jgi:cytochrome P450
MIGAYVDLLIRRLRPIADAGTPANMREWVNWTTFDIVSDLAFGSPFGCLEGSSYHPWVQIVTDNIKQFSYVQALSNMGAGRLMGWIARRGMLKARERYLELVKHKVLQRIELGAERSDLIEGFLKQKDEWQISPEKILANASTLIIAGSESTATLLCGTVFFLLTNPDVLKKLEHEVRSTYADDSEITLISVGKLTYTLAVFNESLRCYPPASISTPRESPPRGGGTVCGEFVPPGTQVNIFQWAINHDARYWTDPFEFKPERFLGDPRYKDDNFEALQPFSVGPRSCIGKQ